MKFFLVIALFLLPQTAKAEELFIPNLSTYWVGMTVTYTACSTPVVGQTVAIDVFDGDDAIYLVTDSTGSISWSGNNNSETIYIFTLDSIRLSIQASPKFHVSIDACEGETTIKVVRG